MLGRLTGSIQHKIIAAITLVFVLILGSSLLFIRGSEREVMADIGEHRARDYGRSYFDGVNTMMLTGTLDQKDVLRKKLEMQEGVKSIRLIRYPGRVGSPTEAEAMPDALEQAALKGESVTQFGADEEGRTVTTVTPIRASKNYLGTNCLSCHAVPEGSVMGALRVTYSLRALDAEVARTMRANGMLNLVLFILGVGFIFMLIRAIIIKPILDLRAHMAKVASGNDLTLRLASGQRDEIGDLVLDMDGMLQQVRASLARVAETSDRLIDSARSIMTASHETAGGAETQRSETNQTVAIIRDLNLLVHKVGESAEDTAQASTDTERQAAHGAGLTREAIEGIQDLVKEIGNTADAIERLEQRSHNINNVLVVIRGIAEQTNLLALNAAIEAARAGDMGRGFAVVADEVRKLATSSHDSTKNIETIITQLQHEARQAVDSTARSRASAEQRSQQLLAAIASLDMIVGKVTDIRGLNVQMVRALNQQKDLTETAQARVVAISRVTEHTAGQATQAQSVSEQLAGLAEELKILVAGFKLA